MRWSVVILLGLSSLSLSCQKTTSGDVGRWDRGEAAKKLDLVGAAARLLVVSYAETNYQGRNKDRKVFAGEVCIALGAGQEVKFLLAEGSEADRIAEAVAQALGHLENLEGKYFGGELPSDLVDLVVSLSASVDLAVEYTHPTLTRTDYSAGGPFWREVMGL